MKINKILISGGWGYRNLGDDAILIATIKLLRKDFPTAKLMVTSYCPKETEAFLQDNNVEVIPSIQRILYGHTLQYGFCAPEKWDLRFKIKNRLWRFAHRVKIRSDYALLEKKPSLFCSAIEIFYSSIRKHFEDIDLFLMSGGGYINESHGCNIGHCLEILLAKKNNVPVWLIGQTIGPFEQERTRKILPIYLQMANRIVVRDLESQTELQHLGIEVDKTIMPDIAISDIYSNNSIKKYITIIPFFGMQSRINDIADILISLSNVTKKEILITVTQLWTLPLKYARELFGAITQKGGNVKYVIPKNVLELQSLLADSELVLSQNLHGLIMAYRSGSKIVALNNRRKFKTFIEQVCPSGLCFDVETFEKKKLLSYCLEVLDNLIEFNSLETIANKISLI